MGQAFTFIPRYTVASKVIYLEPSESAPEAEAKLALAMEAAIKLGATPTEPRVQVIYDQYFSLEAYKAKNPFHSALEEVMLTASVNRSKENAYSTLFTKGSEFTSLLRKVEHDFNRIYLDVYDALKKDYPQCGNDVIAFLKSVPLLAAYLRSYITETEGMTCSTDKVFYLLSEHLKQILEHSRQTPLTKS
jgi:hypothetical protein